MNVRILIFVILVLAFILAGKIYYDTYTLEVRHYRIVHSRLAEALSGAKVVFLSDLHMKRLGPREQEILSILREEKPDVVLLGGDYISFRGSYDPVMAFFHELKNAYAVMGNSDYYNENGSCILCHKPKSYELKSDPNVLFLRNVATLLDTAGGRVNLIGLDDPVNKKGNIAEATSGIAPSFPSILLAHSPDVFEEASSRGIDFVLAGHNHGGQVFLARYLKRQMLVEPSFNYLEGFFQKGRTLMYVGKGVGVSYLPFRLGVRPEVVFFEFINTKDSRLEIAPKVTMIGERRCTVSFSLTNLWDLIGLHDDQESELTKHHAGPLGKLFDFETEEELELLNWSCHKWFEMSEKHATSGQHSLQVTIPPGEYPGIYFKDVEKDWSAYHYLKLDVYNPEAEPIKFHIRVDDKTDGWEYADRFDRNFNIAKGMNHISIPLEGVKANITPRSLDLKNIERFMLFIPGNDRKRTFYIDNIRLE